MTRRVSSLVFLLTLIGSLSGQVLAKETAGGASPGESSHLELSAPIAASAETNQVLRLRGADARQQLLVTASFSTGALRDYTREVSYQTSPAGVIQVSKTGRVTPLAEGTATITAKMRTPPHAAETSPLPSLSSPSDGEERVAAGRERSGLEVQGAKLSSGNSLSVGRGERGVTELTA